MATEITKILPEEYIHKGVIGLPDSPELSTLEMQERFDQIAIEVIIPHINGMCDEIDAAVDGAIETAHAEVVAEQTRAQAAESALSTAITAETTRAQTAEGNLSNAIIIEKNRAEVVENNLSNAINAETSRAQSVENTISTKLDSLGLAVEDGKLCAVYNR